MMALTNRTIYAILGLLAQGPKTGYEIKQVVEKTISHFWNESYGHIYPTLSRLVAEGLVVRDGEASDRVGTRPRYHITPAGQTALATWLAAPLEKEHTRNELALKLYFGQATTLAVSRGHLKAHRDHHRQLLVSYAADRTQLEQQVAAGVQQAVFELITLSLGMHISQARIAWCDDALRRLDQYEQSMNSFTRKVP
jgi:PadR family transcriptional regulator, regulatory protein AphA